MTAVTEHKAVLDSCKHLEQWGCEVTYLPVRSDGLIDLDELRRALRDDTILVSIMAANNETGVLQPFAAIGAMCRQRGIISYGRGTSCRKSHHRCGAGQRRILLSISGHKLYGPKGVGAFIRAPELRCEACTAD